MNSHYWDLAAKELGGTASPAEQEELRRWLAASPAHAEQYLAQQKLWKLTAPEAAVQVDTDKAWRKVKAGLQPQARKQETKVIPLFGPAWRVAASVVLLIGLGWLASLYFFSSANLEVIAAGDRQREVLLPDSSRVWLNRGSTLHYRRDFSSTTRTVELKGEGFFEVRRDPQRPFIIQASGARAEVLGTSFNLRAYPEEDRVELVVETGRVAFSAGGGEGEAIITAGFAGYLDRRGSTIQKEAVSDENAWAWKSGRLRFEARPLQEVLPVVERYYGITFHLQNAGLANCRFTGRFQETELPEVLQVLEATLQIAIEKQPDQTYLLTGPGCREPN